MLPLSICFFCLFLGYFYPRKVGWLFLVFTPVGANLTNWIILDHLYLPLRFNQLAFSVSIGLLLNKSNRERLFQMLPHIRGLKIIALFFSLEFIIGIMNPDATFWRLQLLHNYPLYIAIIILSFSVIRSILDLKFLMMAYAIIAIITAILAIIEIQFGFNVNNYFCFKNFNRCHLSEKDWHFFSYAALHPKILDMNIFNKGAYSYYGFTAQPNLTSIIIAVFSIVGIIGFSGVGKKKSQRNIMVFLLVLSLLVSMISQIRAVIFSVLVIFIVWGIINIRVFKVLLSFLALMILFLSFVPSLNHWFEQFIEVRLSLAHLIDPQRLLAYKESINLFLRSPFWGSLGTIYFAGDTLLNGNDANPFVLYFISGGLILGFCFLIMIAAMVFDLIHLIRSDWANNYKNLVYANVSAIIFLNLTQLFNSNGVLLLILMFYSTCRAAFEDLQQKTNLNN